MNGVDTWSFLLAGEDFDLEDFPLWLAGGSVTIVRREDGKYALTLPVAVAGLDLDAVRLLAQDQLDLLNGMATVLYPEHRPVRLEGLLTGLNAAGATIHQVILAGAGEVRMKGGVPLVVIDGVVPADPRQGAALPILQAASANERIQHALRLLGRANVSWRDLYLVFELVQGDVGGGMIARGWITSAEADRFCRTANSFAVLGYDARHAHARYQPPASPMALSTAREHIRSLLEKWIQAQPR